MSCPSTKDNENLKAILTLPLLIDRKYKYIVVKFWKSFFFLQETIFYSKYGQGFIFFYLFTSSKSLDNSWSLNSFCLVWYWAHVSHKSSSSSHVLQRCVAWTCRLWKKQGLQSFLFSMTISLKYLQFNIVKVFLILKNAIFTF